MKDGKKNFLRPVECKYEIWKNMDYYYYYHYRNGVLGEGVSLGLCDGLRCIWMELGWQLVQPGNRSTQRNVRRRMQLVSRPLKRLVSPSVYAAAA